MIFLSFIKLSKNVIAKKVIPPTCDSTYTYLHLTMLGFSPLKHLAKEDIFFSNSHATTLIKWSKTQFSNHARLLKIPTLNNNFCPVRALRKCLNFIPGGNNWIPLFQFKLFGNWIPMTDSRARKYLKNILQLLGKDTSFITFHSHLCFQPSCLSTGH